MFFEEFLMYSPNSLIACSAVYKKYKNFVILDVYNLWNINWKHKRASREYNMSTVKILFLFRKYDFQNLWGQVIFSQRKDRLLLLEILWVLVCRPFGNIELTASLLHHSWRCSRHTGKTRVWTGCRYCGAFRSWPTFGVCNSRNIYYSWTYSVFKAFRPAGLSYWIFQKIGAPDGGRPLKFEILNAIVLRIQ